MILNEEYLRIYSKTEMRNSVNECYKQIRNLSKDAVYDIFISHSSLDADIVCALYDLFKKSGFNPYLDYNDEELTPLNVTSDTGKKLRERLKNCKCLAYIATANVAKSKWCPWELGLFDGISQGKCCILPISKTTNQYTFKGQEYLGTYPYLSYDKISNSEKYTFWVIDPNNSQKYVSLKSWENGNELINHS